MGIANTDHFVFGHDDQRIGALDAADGLNEIVVLAAEKRLGEQHEDNLAIHRGLKRDSLRLQFIAKLGGIGEIAVVRDRDLAALAVDRQRLGITNVGRTRGGIARMTDCHRSNQVMQHVPAKNLRDQAHAMVLVKITAIARDDAGALLAPMLQGVKPVVGQFRGIRVPENAEDTAVMLRVVLHV
jgi:hypothetical protein